MRNFKFLKRYFSSGILLLTGIFCLAVGQLAFGGSNNGIANQKKIFDQANFTYQKGDFIKAAGLYQQLCDEGFQSGNLFYNLGNAYYKLGAKGRAILNYERAKRLIPGDADLKANLNYALAGVQEGAGDWKYDLLRFLTGMASLEQLAVSGSLCFFGLAVLIILGIIKPAPLRNIMTGNLKRWWLGVIIVFSVTFFMLCTLGTLTYWNQSREQAVAVKAGEVRFEPSKAATLYYHLVEGSRAQILEEKDNWVKVKRIDGKRGWVDRDCLETI